MTGRATAPGVPGAASAPAPTTDPLDLSAGPLGLAACLSALDEAIDAAAALGIDVDEARAVRRTAAERVGFPGATYVVALVGGTGVGKSSLLNALAGGDVSPASALRPTTAEAIAWVPAAARDELARLLEWLDVGGAQVREHRDERLGRVAVVDLPDLDSIDPRHVARVEAVLPRVDAVIWVTDPEKYHDALLHDTFLRRWVPRLDRQVVVLNKVDRLDGDDGERIRRDLERDLAALAPFGARADVRVPIVRTAAATGDVEGVRAWLAERVEAKAVVRARIAASVAAAVGALAAAAGVDPSRDLPPLVVATDRRDAMDAASEALLRVVDLAEVERQAVAATRARARARGTGPLGAITSRVYRWSGREARAADPAAFLARWRERGTLAPAVEPIRRAGAAAVGRVPPAVRPALAASAASDRVEPGLAAAVDRAVALRGRDVPSSPVWPVLGWLQTVTTVALTVAAAWIVLWILFRFPVDLVALPAVGQVPAPLALLVAALVIGYAIVFALRLHAGWVGRRWARRLAGEIRAGVVREVEGSAFVGLDALEVARRSLWDAARRAREHCRA